MLEPARTTGINVVRCALYDTLLIIATYALLRAMGVLIACYLTAIECRAVTIHMQGQRLTSGFSACVLDADVLCIKVRSKDSQRRIVAHILSVSDVIFTISGCNDGFVHTFTYQRDAFGRRFRAQTYLHHFLIGSSLHHDSSRLPFCHSVYSSLNGRIVTTAIFTDG